MLELLPGVMKDERPECVIYFIEAFSEKLKQEVRNRLALVCHGADHANSGSEIYSYKSTVKEFIRRYRTKQDASEDRKKGMIGELLVHIILEIEGRFLSASPFFNMEEASFKKGFDVVLFENATKLLWITEVKSGKIQKNQKNASSSVVELINTAKNDLKKRLNDNNTGLWLNALNAAKIAVSESNNQRKVIEQLLSRCAKDALYEKASSQTFNVVLSAVLFHSLSEPIEASKIDKKHIRVVKENLFKKVFVMVIQKQTFEAVFDFLESEITNEI